MQKQKFSYHLKNKYVLVSIFLFFSLPLYSYEISGNNIPYFDAISNLDFTNTIIKEKLFYSALNGNGAIRIQSALTLSDLEFKNTGDYRIVTEVCERLLEDGYTDIVILEYLLDSYYLQGDYENLIIALNRYKSENTSAKINFYIFFTMFYKNNNSISEYYRNLLIENPASELIVTAYNYIKDSEVDILETTSILANFKYHTYRKEYLSAGSSMSILLKIQKGIISDTLDKGYIVDNVLLTPIILNEMYTIASASGRRGELLSSIEELLSMPGKAGYQSGEVYSYEFLAGLYETAGYLKRRSGSYTAGAEMFMTGLSFADGIQYEKMLWYWFNSLVQISPEMAVSQLELLTEIWTDPDYFVDVLDEMATIFVQKRQWNIIHKILGLLEFSGPEESISKYAYITARAGVESYISISNLEITRLMTLSYNSGFGLASGLYYRILAGNYLKIFDIRQLPWMFNITVSRDPQPQSMGREGSSELVWGWLEFGHFLKAYNFLMDNPFSDFSLVRKTAQELSENNYHAKSIRLLNRYSLIDGFELNNSDLLLIYPDAFKSIIIEIADKEALEWYVFTALVREESHFQQTIVSSAGAIGLSQLMPATAEDVAGRLRITDYNLNDAQTNLLFGGWYLGNLKKRTDVLSDALFAYNGGLTRVRRWRSEYSDLPDDLFLEAIPYKETSHYGRKLLVSSVIYGYLYDGIQADQIINLFYRK